MQEAAVSPILAWANFYVIIGSAAAALTGLMFVAMTLIAGTRVRKSSESIGAFGTPTVVHFCAALLISVILSAPWQALWNVTLLLGLAGLAGVTYVIIIVLRTRRQEAYTPVQEDWLWYVAFPFVAYTVLLVAAILLLVNPALALFGIGAGTVFLLFIGIHNAWDTVTYIAIEEVQTETGSQN